MMTDDDVALEVLHEALERWRGRRLSCCAGPDQRCTILGTTPEERWFRDPWMRACFDALVDDLRDPPDARDGFFKSMTRSASNNAGGLASLFRGGLTNGRVS